MNRAPWKSFLSFALSLSFLLALASVPAQTRASSDSGADPRIDRVENGLLPPVLVKGQKAWNILDRMKLYNIPGVSVAVFSKKRTLASGDTLKLETDYR